MAINYDAPSNTITVTGYSELTPCDLTDLTDAITAGGWGCGTKQGSNQYYFTCNFVIGDNSTTTWVADENVQISISPSFWKIIILKNNSHFRLGKLLNADTLSTEGGCQISLLSPVMGNQLFTCIDEATPTAVLDLYGTTVQCIPNTRVALHSIRHGNFYNVRLEGGIHLDSCSPTIDNLQIIKPEKALSITFSNPITVKNVKVLDYTSVMLNTYQAVGSSYFIDVDTSGWTIAWYQSPLATFYRQHSFNKIIINELEAPYIGKSWTLKDKNGATQHSGTTQADGKLAATDIVVTHGYYNQAGGNTEYESAPYSLWVDGETDYLDLDELDLSMDEKNINGELTMVNVSDIVDGIDDLKGTGFVKNTHSLTDIEERTTNLPDDPADQSQVEAAIATRAPAAEYDTVIAALQTDLTFVRDEAGGKWEIVGDQMIFFKEDATELMRFNLFNASGNPAVSDVTKRERVL